MIIFGMNALIILVAKLNILNFPKHHTDAELVVSMPPKREIAIGVYRLDISNSNRERLNGVLAHDVILFSVAVVRVAGVHNR